jgi:sRNA-binding carbon storage regulator CsrA
MCLVVKLKPLERLVIGSAVVEINYGSGNRFKVYVTAPPDIRVLREGAKQQEKPVAA